MTISAILTACHDDTYIPLVELGAVEKDLVFSPESGTAEIHVYANGAYKVEFLNTPNWLTIDSFGGNSDGVINVSCSANDGFRRSESLVLKSELDSRTDTVFVKQAGTIEEVLQMENTTIAFDAQGGEKSETINTNVPSGEIKISVTYPSDDQWIESWSLTEADNMMLNITANPNNDSNSRSAVMIVTYVDGWGKSMSLTLTLKQEASVNTIFN